MKRCFGLLAFVSLIALGGCGGLGFVPPGGVASFAGTYTGAYTGWDFGNLTMTFDNTGHMSITAKSAQSGSVFTGVGSVDASGNTTANGGGTGGGISFVFTGTFSDLQQCAGSYATSNGFAGKWSVQRDNTANAQ